MIPWRNKMPKPRPVAEREMEAVRLWIERQWKALSKSGAKDGPRAHDLIVLEQDIEAAGKERP